MSSLNTNASAMTALQTLSLTNKNLATTQSRIATGLRVAEASDNAAYWSIATTMRSDNGANSAVQDQLGLGAGKVDVAYTAINDILDATNQIKEKLVTARGASLEDQKKLSTEIETLKSHIKSVASNANYAGSNLLLNDAATASDLNIVASYNRTGTTVTFDEINVTAASTQMFGVTAGGAADYTAGTMNGIVAAAFFQIAPAATDPIANGVIDTALGDVETALGKLADGAASLGAAKSRIDMQQNFVSKLQDSIDRGVGQLVDADMEKESARLSALQVQQQLGIQALSIANSNTQNILSLFR